MPIINKMVIGLEEVAVIVCGGGLGGCVVAGRLAQADPSLSILLIEGGENNDNKLTVETPALFPANLAPDSTTMIRYKDKQSKAVADRDLDIATGDGFIVQGSMGFGLPRPAESAINSFHRRWRLLGRSFYGAGRQRYTIVCYTPYPHSRGNINITGPNVQDLCEFEPGFFGGAEDDFDIKTHV